MVKTQDRLLTYKQELFVDKYLSNGGNGVEAAGDAGYKGCYQVLAQVASENLKKPYIINAIAARKATIIAKNELKILNKLQLQDFWTKTIVSQAPLPDKLRASELLGKSQAVFVDNLQYRDVAKPIELSETEREQLRQLAGHTIDIQITDDTDTVNTVDTGTVDL